MIIDEKYLIEGMTCSACSARVNKVVSTLNGIKQVNVNLLTNSMVVTYDESLVNSQDICNSVSKAGYKATKCEDNNQETLKQLLEDNQTPKLLKRLIISIILLIPLFYLGMGYMLNWPIGVFVTNPLLLSLTELFLALAIMIINHKFFTNGVKALIHLSPNMDTLIALGSGVAFIYSTVMTIIVIYQVANGYSDMEVNMALMNLSFETAGMVPTLIIIGKTLESYSKSKTTNSIKSLLDLSPKTIRVIKDDKEFIIQTKDVEIDDIFLLKAGESVPVDGIIIKGESYVDESIITGESLPLFKKENDVVKSGSINTNGVLYCKAIRVGEDTTVNQIIKLVEKASNSKAKISRIADKVSGIFVPIVLLLALITFIIWLIIGDSFLASHTDIYSTLLSYAFNRAISVLVISCPCALGLATPVAIMVGSGKGAKNGILFKNAEVIEETGKIDYIVFDKTGTITKGKPVVSDIVSYINEEEFFQLVYSLENTSEHPLSLAIKEKELEKGIPLLEINNINVIPGKGIEGFYQNKHLIGGNYNLLNELGINLSKCHKDYEYLSSQGKTVLLFSYNHSLIGLIAVSDEIKPEAKEAINNIKNLGIIPIMVTGDNEKAAQYIADQVGIKYVLSNVLPQQKLEIIEEIKKHGKIMMIGDGINDAAALKSATIGMAIGQGSDVSIESADIVLMKSSLLDAYGAIRLSQLSYKNIKENLFWAFIYNIIMIPIAAGALSGVGLYKIAPWMGSAAMAASSVLVVLNSLRINTFNIYKPKSKTKHVNTEFLDKLNIYEIKEGDNMTKILHVDGMMCPHCVMHVTKALEAIEGVEKADVSLDNKQAVVILKQDVDTSILIKAVEDAGYQAKEN